METHNMHDWSSRLRSRFVGQPGTFLICADLKWGPPRLLAGTLAAEVPNVVIDLSHADCCDAISLGNHFSEALRLGLGAPLFGLGVTLDHGLAIFATVLSSIEPLQVSVLNLDDCPEFAARIEPLVRPPNTLILHARQDVELPLGTRLVDSIDESDLAVTLEEAIEMFGNAFPESEIIEALRVSEGAVVSMERALNIDDGENPSLRGMIHVVGQMGAEPVDFLVSQRRWMDAFEAASRLAPHRAAEIVRSAGNEAFEQGQFKRFWAAISRLPVWTRRDDGIAYWWLSAAVAVNKWRPILASVDTLLARREAPELRALRATVELGAASIEQAARAFRTKSCGVTASALGFAYLFNGQTGEAVESLHSAIDLSESEGSPRIAVTSAMNLALANVTRGDYRAASYWSGWSIRRFHALGLREELLRIAVVNIDAFANLLAGSERAAEAALASVSVPTSALGIPSLEGIISTLGDLEVARGDFESAIRRYMVNRSSESREAIALTANDLVRANLGIQDLEAAVRIGEEAVAVADGLPDHFVRVAQLALGCALAGQQHADAEPLLRDAFSTFRQHPFSTHFAQSAIHLARYYLQCSRMREAQAVLAAAKPVLRDLGGSGWRLLAGSTDRLDELRAWTRSDSPQWDFRILGQPRVMNRGEGLPLSPRFAELFTVLAAHPDGIRGEALAIALYGERAKQSTLKATVSRARRIVPIDSAPYRIAEPFRADFTEVLSLLQHGRVQAALELYRGPLLPASEAPMVVELRGYLEESLRQAVLSSDDPDALIDFANQQGEDLQLWEEALRQLPPNDPRRPLVNARIRRIRKGW